jgi:tetratricopeptide (TPR) repeat protein
MRLGTLFTLTLFVWMGAAWTIGVVHAQPPCEEGIGKIRSIQGRVKAMRSGETQWFPVRPDTTFCPGDRLTTGANSRAAVTLNNDAVLRINQNTTIVFQGREKEPTFLMDLLKGAAHIFSREARSLKIDTPFLNGAVEGTEFLVRVDQTRTSIFLFEGQVLADNAHGSLALRKGQCAVAQAGGPPEMTAVVRPRDAVQWTLYYPPIMVFNPKDDHDTLPQSLQARLDRSMAAYGRGDLVQAFDMIDGLGDGITESRFFTYRAGLSLRVGGVTQASADIEKALELDAGSSEALALRAIIAVVQNRKETAYADARRAARLSPDSPTALIALSYAHQARFNLPAALNAARRAAKRAPDNAVARARLAELRLSSGDADGALAAAQQAVHLDSLQARTQTVLGYAYLTQLDLEKSMAAFGRAIRLDSAAPLPRLGLGLVKIRQGHLKAGRAEVELAAGLDPDNALIRSYLGKAYFDEKRRPLEARQLEMAKELDPHDPTPWYYDAIRKQSQNRPVEALHDLQQSIELNHNRAVYRSRLLLDEDHAARSASLGRIYRDLGFQELALRQGWRSLQSDPSNYSAHRLLADSYGTRPRHEIARVSELLQAQLLQPLSITPVQPQLAESNLLTPQGAGPGSVSFNEFNPLFARNRIDAQADGLVGNHQTWGDEVVLFGMYDRISASAGQYHYETEGFRENNDLDQDIYDVMAQAALTPKVNLQAEYRHRRIENGDLSFDWDLKDGQTSFREETEADILRAGLRLKPWIHSDVIASVMVLDKCVKQDTLLFMTHVTSEVQSDGVSAEMQYLFRSHPADIIAGGGYYDIDEDLKIGPLSTPTENRHGIGYLYSYFRFPHNAMWTIGASYDSLDREERPDKSQLNPKVGLNLDIAKGTTLRLAALTGLKRVLVADQTIEPTHVAGFNQLYDDRDATDYVLYGAGIDQTFNGNVHGGGEVNLRKLTTPFVAVNNPEEQWEETIYRFYLYWTMNRYLALGMEYRYELFSRDKLITMMIPEETKTEIVPVHLVYFHPSGGFGRLVSTYVSQDVVRSRSPDVTVADDFALVDMAMGYRLPKRYGILSVEINNLLNRGFNYMDVASRSSQEVVSPLFLPDRSVVFRITLSF